jgi:hypothetical protein
MLQPSEFQAGSKWLIYRVFFLEMVKVELSFDNNRRPPSSLDRQTPDQVYFTKLPPIAAA